MMVPSRVAITDIFGGIIMRNYEVPISIGLVWAFFWLGLLWMFLLDKCSAKRKRIIYLNDHIQERGYGYLIIFKTGHRKNAGTTSQVRVKLHESRNVTDEIPLSTTDDEVFQRGEEDWFYFTEERRFSDLIGLSIFVKFKRDKPSWYLNQVWIKDLTSRKKWIFSVNEWYIPEGRSQVEYYFVPLTPKEKRSFKMLWKLRAKNDLRNRYLWLSLFNFPARTHFSRAQRLAIVLSTYLLSIFMTTLFYNDFIIRIKETYISKDVFGVTLSEKQIFVATFSTLIALVYEIIMIELFLGIETPDPNPIHPVLERPERKKEESSIEIPRSSSFHEEVNVRQLHNSQTSSPSWSSRIFTPREDNFTRPEPRGLSHYPSPRSSQRSEIFESSESLNQRPSPTTTPGSPRLTPTRDSVDKQRFRRRCRRLPRCCLHRLWCVVWVFSVGCTVVTLLYGLTLDQEKSVDWLLSNVYAVALEVLLWQPMYALVAAIVINYCCCIS